MTAPIAAPAAIPTATQIANVIRVESRPIVQASMADNHGRAR
jgi:hypothetical protein